LGVIELKPTSLTSSKPLTRLKIIPHYSSALKAINPEPFGPIKCAPNPAVVAAQVVVSIMEVGELVRMAIADTA